MASNSLIIETYLEALRGQETGKLSPEDLEDEFIAPLRELLAVQGAFQLPLSYYLHIIDNTNEVLIEYMSEEQQNSHRRHLQIAYLLLLAQKQHEYSTNLFENRSLYDNYIAQCERFIDKLNPNIQQQSEAQANLSPELPIKYIGLGLGIEISEEVLEWLGLKSKDLRAKMDSLNQKRLYWVWASSLLKMLLDLTPPDFFNAERAGKLARTPDPYTGALSWILYYFRFAVNVSLAFKHSWVSDENNPIPWHERFTTQLEQRKFTLLNDIFWATANLACYFWLIAQKGLGPYGDLVTLALLLFDIGMTVWSLMEQHVKHNKELLEYDKNIGFLNGKIVAAKTNPDFDAELKKRKIKEYEQQIHDLMRAKAQCKKDWAYTKLSLINETAYASGLFLAFILLTLPFLPIAGPSLLALTLTGAILCFAFSIIYSVISQNIEISKSRDSAKEAKEEYAIKLGEFITLKNDPTKINEMKFLFLEMKQLQAKTEYQQKMIVLQTMHLYSKVLLEALIPVIVFANLVFFPLGIGLGVLAAVVVLAMGANLLIDKIYTPETPKLPEFPESEFEAFYQNPKTLPKPVAQSKSSFFSSNSKTADNADDDTNTPEQTNPNLSY